MNRARARGPERATIRPPRVGSADGRDMIRWATSQGWTCHVTGSGHLRFDHAEVTGPVFTAVTPRANGWHKERQKLATALRRGCNALASTQTPHNSKAHTAGTGCPARVVAAPTRIGRPDANLNGFR